MVKEGKVLELLENTQTVEEQTLLCGFFYNTNGSRGNLVSLLELSKSRNLNKVTCTAMITFGTYP